ncbi:MAG: hypothetical protein ACOC5I_02865 [Gemmatimonadota bacterium]
MAAPRKRGRGVLWTLIAMVVAFGAGFGWQFYEASRVRAELADTQQQLLVERLRVRLGQAAIAAQSGDYESARQRMSDFFTRLDAASPELPDSITVVTDQFLAVRDEVITGLSRANSEYAGVLYGMLDRFRNVAGLDEGVTTAPAEPESEPASTPDTQAPMETDPDG